MASVLPRDPLIPLILGLGFLFTAALQIYYSVNGVEYDVFEWLRFIGLAVAGMIGLGIWYIEHKHNN